MSGAFSDDLSDPTPSPPPVVVRTSTANKSSTAPGNNSNNNNTRRGSTATSKATTHQRTTSAASASATTRVHAPHGHRGTAVALASASHSRNTSLANSLVMSQSAASGKGTMVNGQPGSDDDEDDDEGEEEEEEEDNGSQSGSELSSAPSEGEDQTKRVITEEPLDANDEANDEENEEGDGGDNEDDEKLNDGLSDSDDPIHPFVAPPQPRHGRTSSGGTGPGILPPRATRQSSLRSGSAAGRTGRGVIPAGMWEWAKPKNYKKAKANKSDDDDEDGSDGEEEEEEEEEEEDGAGVEGRPGHSRGESLVQQARNAADEDEPMLNGVTNPHSPNGTFNSDDDVTTQHLPIPTVKIEPPPSATMSSFRAQDVAHPSPSVSPAPTPAPTGPPERRTNGRSKASGRTHSKRSHRAPPASKRATAAQQQQQQQLQLQLQQQQIQDAEDDAEAEEVERANREMEVAEDAEEGEDEDGELEGEGEYGNRQDALDALSLLELKFALLRQRIYQDKMDELAREERFVRDGSHPELLHTYMELDKRKERRATLADLKRKREVDLAAVTRTNDEDAVWSWWIVQKDVVQSTLITEASRKRRRVERERRALLDPLRRTLGRVTPPVEPPLSRDKDGDEDMFPSRPSTKAILAVALRHPYARLRTYDNTQIAKEKNGENAVGPTGAAWTGKVQESMPTLSQLDPGSINEDLSVFQGYRRGSGALGAVINAGAGLGMPEAGIPGGIGAPSGIYGPPGMDAGRSGTVTVNSAVVAPAPEAFNPGIGVIAVDPPPTGGALPYPRSMYELEQRERGRHRDGQAFNDHLATHQYLSTGMPPNGSGKGSSNGRERERDRDRLGSKKTSTSNAPSMGHANYVSGQAPAPQQQQQQQQQQRERDMHSHGGYSSHSHRQAMDPYASPGLGLQNMQRLPDTGNPRDRERDRDSGMGGIQHMPLPPAPSTIPAGSSSGASKHHHHHHPTSAGAGHPQAGQHPSLMWETPRRERDRDRDGDLARERSHSNANRNPSMSGSGYATNPGPSSGNGGGSSSSGRPHSHSVSHQHQHAHYHPTHTHSRSSAQGSSAHGHSHGVIHTHPHSHSHPAGSTSHLHVIHNHGPSPTGNGGSTGGNGVGASSSSSRRNNAYDESTSGPSGNSHRSRTSYPSGPTVDREKELRERERLAGAVPSMNVMHPSLSHGGGQERDRHTGYSIPHSSRDSWVDRDREKVRPKERDERRDSDRDRERERTSHSQGGMSGIPSFSGHQTPQQQQQQQAGGDGTRGSRSGSLSMHPSQGNSYSQGSRYSYANPSAYSPPATQASQSRRNSPPPLLPPVPNTSRYGTSSSTHRRPSPSPTDPLSYSSSSQAQAETTAAHSPTSSLNPPGFNPWSAPPRSSGRSYRPSSPPQKITPPTGTSFNSSAGGGPLNTLPGPTLSPILPSAVSPAPRPSISPAPRPPSSSSLHAILQPSPRESALSPQPLKRNGSGSGEGGSGVGPMELDSPVQQQQTGIRHPSLAPLNHEGK